MKINKPNHKWPAWLVLLILLASIADFVHAQQLSDLLSGNGSPETASAPDKVILIDHSKQNDKKVEKRLLQIFSELDDLKAIKASVSNGVVTLQGEVGSTLAKGKAERLAKQVENVVEVKNNLLISHSLNKRIEKTFHKMMTLGEEAIAGLPLLLLAIVIFILFMLLGRWCSQWHSLYRRISANYFIADLLGKLAYLACIIIGVITALTLLDATALISTVLGAAGILGLAVGFAIKDTVENFITSLLLSLRNPFEVNDYVSIDGHEGSVARLTSRATILISPDGNHIRIPNAAVFKAVIINYTRKPERRFQFDIGIDTNQDLLIAQGLALKTLTIVTGVLADPKPMVLIEELGDSNVLLRLYGWVNQRNCSLGRVRSEAIRYVKQAFDEANIAIPEPIYNLRLSQQNHQFTEKRLEKPASINKPAGEEEIKHQTDEVKDVTVDRIVENQIAKENVQHESQNLLNSNAPNEM
jgi:small conductance mechanosensitive channel